MKYYFLLLLFLSNQLYGYSIDEMLDFYRIDSDLSKKTKDEALGHLTVYTRDDIERMQAHTLSDLTNSIRSFRYDENLFGMPDYLHVDPLLYSSSVVKIFINDYEISSTYAGSGLYIYGNIDLGFVDHVEIYEGSTSTSVNSEPSIITIKLYSKDPSRELGGRVAGYVGSRGTNHQNVSYALAYNDLKTYIYASRTDSNRVEYENNFHKISRDSENLHALMTLDYKKFNFEAEIIDHKMDPFLSLSMFGAPNDGDIDYQLKRLSSSMTFLDDDSLKLKLSFTRIDGKTNLSMAGSRWSSDPLSLFRTEDSLVTNSIDDIYDIKLEKSIYYGANHIIIGSQYVKKWLHGVTSYNRGVKNLNEEYVDNDIFSLYIQDDYLINENQMFTISAKSNHYNSRSNRDTRNFETTQFRLGYIYNSDTDVVKIFASQMELPTEQFVLTSTPENKIEILNVRDYSFEYIKTLGAHKISSCVELIQNENPQSTRIAYGNSKYFNNYSGSLKYDYEFNKFNTLKSMVYTNKYHNQVTQEIDTVRGGFVRLLNKYRKFDFYNEANYFRELNTEINGINYNVGVRYHATRALIFSLKGTNAFNSAAKSKYSYVNIVGGVPVLDNLYYSPIDQTFTAGLEYSF